MKKIIIIFTACLMLTALCACEKVTSDDPNSGVYEGRSASMGGFDMDITDVFEDGFSIELKDKGKGTIHLNGDDASFKWTLDGTEFSGKGGGAELSGTLKDGVLELTDVIGTGIDMVLVCDEIASGSAGSMKYDSVLDRLKAVNDGEIVYDADDAFADGVPTTGAVAS